MATRPDNHITGDSAFRKISDVLIPEEWTISKPDSDYGLDMLVEVVINSTTTGKYIFIQSKGTLSSSRNGVISYPMSVERIKDYYEIELPVLFVFYSKAENKFWGRWMNWLYLSLTPRQKKQKSLTLKFTSDNLIDVDYLRRIGPYLNNTITNRVSLCCESLPDAFKRFHNKLFSVSLCFLGNDITDDSHLTFESIVLSYEGTPQKGVIALSSKGRTFRIPIDLDSYEFLYLPSIKQEDCPDCFLDSVCIIAFLCSRYSAKCLDYVLSNPRQKALDWISLDEWMEFIYQLPYESINKVSGLFDVSLQSQHDDIAQSIMIVLLKASIEHEGLRSLYQQLLLRYLQCDREDGFKGNMYYNLANSMRDVDLYESISLYMRAVKYEPTYRKTFYWWEEVGGVLYLTEHFYCAEQFYKKARQLSSELCREDIGILISDCLVCQGKTKEALDEERSFFNTLNVVPSRIHLKTMITEIMDSQGIGVLDSDYWFNHGISASEKRNHKESLKCFLYAWRLNDGDIEALVNAFFEACSISDLVKAAFILDILRKQSPENGYRMIVSSILSNTEPNNEADEFLDTIRNILIEDIL